MNLFSPGPQAGVFLVARFYGPPRTRRGCSGRLVTGRGGQRRHRLRPRLEGNLSLAEKLSLRAMDIREIMRSATRLI